MKRVVVTGLGALSPGGVGVAAYRGWRAHGRGEEVPRFDPSDYIQNPRLLRSMHRSFQLITAVSVLAMRQASLPRAEAIPSAAIAPERAGLAAALPDLSPLTPDLLQLLSELSAPLRADAPLPLARLADLGVHQLHPFRRLTLLANMACAHTSLLFNLQGPSFTFTSGPTAGGQTITESFWTIAEGRADLMLCQAVASPQQTFSSQAAPELAGAVVLEELESALRRRAPVLAELAGDFSSISLGSTRWQSPAESLLHAVLQLDGGAGALDKVVPLSALAAPARIAS